MTWTGLGQVVLGNLYQVWNEKFVLKFILFQQMCISNIEHAALILMWLYSIYMLLVMFLNHVFQQERFNAIARIFGIGNKNGGILRKCYSFSCWYKNCKNVWGIDIPILVNANTFVKVDPQIEKESRRAIS